MSKEEFSKKRPYNLREKKVKNVAYRTLIRPALADELYNKILNIIVGQKKYKDADYADKNVEEISDMVGFSNRQSFYAAFFKNVGITPRKYRMTHR